MFLHVRAPKVRLPKNVVPESNWVFLENHKDLGAETSEKIGGFKAIDLFERAGLLATLKNDLSFKVMDEAAKKLLKQKEFQEQQVTKGAVESSKELVEVSTPAKRKKTLSSKSPMAASVEKKLLLPSPHDASFPEGALVAAPSGLPGVMAAKLP